eukprot:TRINITY_DN1532_c0_g1_i3.p1 TRINITY_DN1532_c0_g1~~TRINITY_DN1532_c0_g1_i3.p1  ORF type:complete len:297 (-),score=65.14 TRINITY_DN1532_c0_g1_i3:402-1256(-)
MQQYEVTFYEAFEEEQEQLKHFLAGTSVRAQYFKGTIQEVGDFPQPPSKVISVRTQSVLPLRWAPYLNLVLSRSTGYDHLLRFRNAAEQKTTCEYLPLYCARAVAEQAALLWMSLLRKLPRQIKHFGTFDRDNITGLECEKKVLLVVGVGHIGSQVVRIGLGLGMEVVGVDLVRKWDFVRYADDVDAALPRADVVVCAMNLTALNRGYFDARRLALCKRGCVFVNVSRGELSPSQHLLAALCEGTLGGVGIDVYEHEQVRQTYSVKYAAWSSAPIIVCRNWRRC